MKTNFRRKYIFFSDLILGFILEILKFRKSHPRYCHKMYSYGKKIVSPVPYDGYNRWMFIFCTGRSGYMETIRKRLLLILTRFSVVCQAKSSGTGRFSRQHGAVRWWSVRLVTINYYWAISDNTATVVNGTDPFAPNSTRVHSTQLDRLVNIGKWNVVELSNSVCGVKVSRKHDLREQKWTKIHALHVGKFDFDRLV